MTFIVNGVDITPYIAHGGVKWSRNDVDGPNAGRMLENGDMDRDRVSTKYRWDITCRPLTAAEQAIVLTAIEPVFVPVTTIDPQTNTTSTFTCYANNFPSTYMIEDANGNEWWTGLAFPLIQK